MQLLFVGVVAVLVWFIARGRRDDAPSTGSAWQGAPNMLLGPRSLNEPPRRAPTRAAPMPAGAPSPLRVQTAPPQVDSQTDPSYEFFGWAPPLEGAWSPDPPPAFDMPAVGTELAPGDFEAFLAQWDSHFGAAPDATPAAEPPSDPAFEAALASWGT